MRIGFMIGLSILAMGIGNVTLAGPEKRFDPGTETCREFTFEAMMDGYKSFRTVCKNCHNREGDGGFIYTESKNPVAWNRVFFEKYPTCATDGSWESLSNEDKLKLNDYLFRNAANNYDPNDATCG